MSIEKKEGAKKTCHICNSNLVCHEKIYPARVGYPEKRKLQWQNQDGSAHYQYDNGRYKCVDKHKNEIKSKSDSSDSKFTFDNISDMELESVTLDSTNLSENSTLTSTISLESNEKVILEILNERIDRLTEMVTAIFQYVVDKQLKEAKQPS